MPGPAARYINGMSEKFQLLATWPPNAPLRVGDVGLMNGRVFKVQSSLSQLGIPFRVRPAGAPAEWKHSSGAGVKIHLGGEGNAGAASANAVVDLEGEGAFLFQGKECRVHVMENVAAVGKAVLAKHDEGKWELDWVFIDTIVTTSSATAIISASAKASVALNAQGDLKGLVPLAAGLSVSTYTGDVLSIVAEHEMTPLFSATGLVKRWLGSPKVVSGFRAGEMQHDVVQVRADMLDTGPWPDRLTEE